MLYFLLADHRESRSGVVEALQKFEGWQVTYQQLPTGDYLNDAFIFERKTLIDFANSLLDGRLFQQAIRMANDSRQSILILEGVGSDLARVSLRRAQLQGALIRLSLSLGVVVLRSKNPVETANLIRYVVQQQEVSMRRPVHVRQERVGRKKQFQLRLLQKFPGIGAQKAQSLLEHFDSLEAVFSATEAELASIHGIGYRTARNIRSLLEEPACVWKSPA
jgi:DNA excision repair protein ERCC-4